MNTTESTISSIAKRILKLALPMSSQQLITSGSGFLCMAMLAQLGHKVLAASSLIFATQMTFSTIGLSILFSISLLVSHADGAKDYAKVGSIMQQGWRFGIIISIPVMILFWHIGAILICLHQDPTIAAIVQKFFHVFLWGVIPLFLLAANNQLCFGVRQQHLSLKISIAGVLVLLITAYILIFGKFGAPALGVQGFAYAMVLQYVFVLITTLTCFYRMEFFQKFHLFSRLNQLHRDWKNMKLILALGWPMSLQISGELLSFFVNTTMIGWLGVHALGAAQVVGQYQFLCVIPIFALAQATSILIGHAVGSKALHEVKRLGYISVGFSVGLTLIFAIIFISFPKFLASLYINVHDPINSSVLHLIVLLFIIGSISQIFDAVRNTLTGALRGVLDTRFPMFISIGVIWIVGVPLSYFFAFTLALGIIGIPLGAIAGIIISTILLFWRWQIMTRGYNL